MIFIFNVAILTFQKITNSGTLTSRIPKYDPDCGMRTREVKILNQQQSRAEIITLFMGQINGLKLRLNVCEILFFSLISSCT